MTILVRLFSKRRGPSSFETTHFCSRWTFSFVDRLIARGAQHPLQEDDLDHVNSQYRAVSAIDRFEATWKDEQRRREKPSL